MADSTAPSSPNPRPLELGRVLVHRPRLRVDPDTRDSGVFNVFPSLAFVSRGCFHCQIRA